MRFSRDLLTSHPLMQPRTAKGQPLSLKVTSWGEVGWFGDGSRYYYTHEHQNGHKYPPIPLLVKRIVSEAVEQTWHSDPNGDGYVDKNCDDGITFGDIIHTCLLNYYPAATGKLGRHQDVTEQDRVSPIVTISLGDSAIFNIGSEDYNDKGRDIQVDSGDVIVMCGPSRLAYHSIKQILGGTSDLLKNGGRISLTARKVYT